MRLEHFIASRYLRSPKSHSVINIISRVSMVAMAVPVAALIILLSIFNGLDLMVREHLQAVDADLRITAREGTTFPIESIDSVALSEVEGIRSVSCVLEQSAMVESQGERVLITLKGVDRNYAQTLPIADRLIGGSFTTELDDENSIVVGQRIVMQLGLQRDGIGREVSLYSINRQRISSLLKLGGYTRRDLPVAGAFAIDEDNGLVAFTSLRLAQDLFNYPERISSVELSLEPEADEEQVAGRVKALVGEDFRVQTRYESNSIYRLMNLERWGVFLIAIFVMLIASLSIVGTLIMVIIDKQDDISTLRTMGASQEMIYRIFFSEGGFMAAISLVAGLVLGVGLSLAQQQWGLVSLTTQTLLIDSYPIDLRWSDVVLCTLTYGVVAFAVIHLTVRGALRKAD